MLLLFVFLISVVPVSSNEENKYNALHFGTSNSDYVEFNFDMSPFRNSFSVCTWIKKISTSTSIPTVFNYYHGSSAREILITSNGAETYVLDDGGLNSYRSRFTHPAGTWYNYCLTWSLSSRTSRLYLDGKLVGTDQTPSRTLHMGGKLIFNRLSTSWGTYSAYVFGGEIFQFNMFSEELSAADVKKIAEGGLCADLEDFEETRVLRWEDILYRSRSGSVRASDTGCKQMLVFRKSLSAMLNETKSKLEVTEGKLEATEGKLEATEGKLESTEGKLEATEGKLEATEGKLEATEGKLEVTEGKLETVSSDLNQTKDLLETKTAEQKKTVEQLETCSITLGDTRSELAGARKFENITRWDVLYTAPYFNNVFTEEFYEQLISSWDMLRKFVGGNITEGIVDHFRRYHIEDECEAFDFAMLDQFVGVELTTGMVEHFRQKHKESPCNNTTES